MAGDKGKCAINLSSGSNMIFDHCSIEWGRWDCLGLTGGSHDITFQYCLIGEGVDPQRFGSLSDSVTNITYSHNLWINNQSRNPKAKGRIQYVNNVVYNWGVCGLVGGHSEADHCLDAIGNYFISLPGPIRPPMPWVNSKPPTMFISAITSRTPTRTASCRAANWSPPTLAAAKRHPRSAAL
jgi:hypothetical protein